MKRNTKTEHALSSGGIIFKKTPKGIRVALISREKGKIWCLPKGLVAKGEKSEEGALREVKEETGLKGKLLGKINDIDYWFFWGGKRIHKVVHFYLIRYRSGSTEEHDFEVDEAKWFSIEEAFKKLTYKNEAKIMKKAKKMIDKL